MSTTVQTPPISIFLPHPPGVREQVPLEWHPETRTYTQEGRPVSRAELQGPMEDTLALNLKPVTEICRDLREERISREEWRVRVLAYIETARKLAATFFSGGLQVGFTGHHDAGRAYVAQCAPQDTEWLDGMGFKKRPPSKLAERIEERIVGQIAELPAALRYGEGEP